MIAGTSGEGSSVVIDGIGKAWQLASSSECTDWAIPCERVTIHRALDNLGSELRPQGFQISGVFDPWPLWVAHRSSKVADDNPRFGTTHQAMDWGEVAIDEGTFAFREIGGACRFRFRSENQADLWPAFDAVYSGLCFLFGCRVRLRGWQCWVNEQMENVLLGGRPAAVTRVYPPLDNFLWSLKGPSGFEEVLALASRFLLTGLGQKVRAMLALIWDAADLPIQSRLLVTATTLEGLVRRVQRHEEQPFAYTEQVRECLTQAGAAATLLKRVEGLLSSMAGLHVPTVLKQWLKEGRYNVRAEEVDAFKRRRNPLAHGAMLVMPEDSQARQDLALMTNLVNKVILVEMDYHGPYADYSASRSYDDHCSVII